MTSFLFLERELLGAIRARSATWLSLALFTLFLFLACFAALFLLPDADGRGADEIVARVSPRLSPATINALFTRLQERSDLQKVDFNLPETVTSDRTAGTFTLVARPDADVDAIVESLRATDGITVVETTTRARGIALSRGARLALLCGLVVCALGSLVLAREGFRALLATFRGEVRLLRLSGIAERQLLAAVIAAGLLVGFLAGLLLVLGLALYGVSSSDAEAAASVTRLVGVGGVSILLGVLMGGLMGLLGVGHLSSRRFSPIA